MDILEKKMYLYYQILYLYYNNIYVYIFILNQKYNKIT